MLNELVELELNNNILSAGLVFNNESWLINWSYVLYVKA